MTQASFVVFISKLRATGPYGKKIRNTRSGAIISLYEDYEVCNEYNYRTASNRYEGTLLLLAKAISDDETIPAAQKVSMMENAFNYADGEVAEATLQNLMTYYDEALSQVDKTKKYTPA